MLPLRLFRNPSFTGAQVGAFGISASLFAMWLYMTIYLQQILGLSAIEAGLVYVPGTLLNFFVAGAMASVGQKVSPRVLIAAGLALIGAGQALLTVLAVDSPWWMFLPGLLVAMLGTGMFNPAVSQVALSSAPPEQSGLAAGVNDMFRQAGIAVGVAALGALIPAGAALRRRLAAGLRRRLPRRPVGGRRGGRRGRGRDGAADPRAAQPGIAGDVALETA